MDEVEKSEVRQGLCLKDVSMYGREVHRWPSGSPIATRRTSEYDAGAKFVNVDGFS